MPQQTVDGAQLMCSFGITPSRLTVLPINRTMCGGTPAANIGDHVPMLNIQPFGMCTTPSNPQVAAATAAALGVLTPQPCMPVTTAPWLPGAPTVMIGGQPALDSTSKCMCTWGGVISILFPGQIPTQVP
jgi:Domain of unknown function (DUF4280)